MKKRSGVWLAAFTAAVVTAILVTSSAAGAYTGDFPCCGNSGCSTLKPRQGCASGGETACTADGFTRCCGDDVHAGQPADEPGCSNEPEEEL